MFEDAEVKVSHFGAKLNNIEINGTCSSGWTMDEVFLHHFFCELILIEMCDRGFSAVFDSKLNFLIIFENRCVNR